MIVEPFRYQADKLIENLYQVRGCPALWGTLIIMLWLRNEGYDYLINKGYYR